MELSTAIHLIERGILKSNGTQRWVDLGAGDGLFTQALGSILPDNSSVLAIDQKTSFLKSLKWDFKSVSLQTLSGNFVSINWGENFDGILMANALHYVNTQADFLSKLRTRLSPTGRLIIVEYERRKANGWVPYPIDFLKLTEVAKNAGFSLVTKLEEVPSIYEGVTMYSSVISY